MIHYNITVKQWACYILLADIVKDIKHIQLNLPFFGVVILRVSIAKEQVVLGSLLVSS
jgi:hypothetical protein